MNTKTQTPYKIRQKRCTTALNLRTYGLGGNDCSIFLRSAILHLNAPVESEICKHCARRSTPIWANESSVIWPRFWTWPYKSTSSFTALFISTIVRSSSCDASGNVRRCSIVSSTAKCSFDHISSNSAAFCCNLSLSSVFRDASSYMSGALTHQRTRPGVGVWVFDLVGDVHRLVRCVESCCDSAIKHRRGSTVNQSAIVSNRRRGIGQEFLLPMNKSKQQRLCVT